MQGNYFSSRINVERTGEQYYLGQYNSQKRRRMSYGTGTQVEAQMINKCRVIIIRRMLYKRRRTPMIRGSEAGEQKSKEKGRRRERKRDKFCKQSLSYYSMNCYPRKLNKTSLRSNGCMAY